VFFRFFSLLSLISIQRLALRKPQDFVAQSLAACPAEINGHFVCSGADLFPHIELPGLLAAALCLYRGFVSRPIHATFRYIVPSGYSFVQCSITSC
jgi:hypothetical protein